MDSPRIDIELAGDGAGPGFKAGYGVHNNKEVFGLYFNDLPTQMLYYVEDLLKKDDTVFDRAKETMTFYFDAGGNGRPIYCSIAELRRVMFELGLIPDEDGRYNLAGFTRYLSSHAKSFFEYTKHLIDSGEPGWDDPLYLGDWWEAFDGYEGDV